MLKKEAIQDIGDEDPRPRLSPLGERLALLEEKGEWLFVHLSRSTSGKLDWRFFTQWDSKSPITKVYESRIISAVKAEDVVQVFEKLGDQCWVLSEEGDLLPYLLSGGPAVVQRKIIRKHFRKLTCSLKCARSEQGWYVGDLKSHAALWNAPNPYLRMRVFERDGFKCVLCGRSPSTYTDVELHIHHIRPLSIGGLTEYANLITLCHTCHRGVHTAGIEESLNVYVRGLGHQDFRLPLRCDLNAFNSLSGDERWKLNHLAQDCVFLQTDWKSSSVTDLVDKPKTVRFQPAGNDNIDQPVE